MRKKFHSQILEPLTKNKQTFLKKGTMKCLNECIIKLIIYASTIFFFIYT